MRPTMASLFVIKHISLPRLSPKHTRGRILRLLINKPPTPIVSYDAVFIMKASEDMQMEGFRPMLHHKELMIIEAHDEGTIQKLDDYGKKWMDV
eukprot:5695269-Ditylum_brightwellii.AAC.1